MTKEPAKALIPNGQTKNFNGIDVVKFICSILVFMIHVPLIHSTFGGELSALSNHINYGIQRSFTRVAVPFFFVSSGFFLFRKMPDKLDVEIVKDYCFKLIRLLGVWSILLFFGGITHLWYLGATVVAVVFLSICLHFNIKHKHLLLIALALYTVGLFGDSYFGFIKPFTEGGITGILYDIYMFFLGSTRNGLFMGFMFVLIGFFFAKGKIHMKAWVSAVGFVLSTIGLIAEVFLLTYYKIPDDYNMYVFLVPAVLFLFSFASSLKLKDRPIYARLRSVGTLIYILHLLLYSFVVFLAEICKSLIGIDFLPFGFYVTLLLTLFAAFGIESLSHKDKFKWIKWIIS